jgi:glucokinase
MADFHIGFDLGGTKMLAGVVGPGYQVLSKTKRKSQTQAGSEAVYADIVATLKDVLTQAGKSPRDIGAVGMSVPGILDRKKGTVVRAPNLGFQNFPLADRLEAEFGFPIVLENDVNAGVWGEFVAGAAQGHRHVLGVFPGTGIGGGLILNGELYSGFGGNAGEIGHMILQLEGPLCGCGNRGCVEALASRTAMGKEAAGLIANGTLTGSYAENGADLKAISSKFFSQGLKEGNPHIIGIIDRAADLLGTHLGGCLNLLNPELVLLGGGLVEKLGDYYLQRVERAMRAAAWEFVADDTIVKAAVLGDDAGILGAADLAKKAALRSGVTGA